MVAPAVSAGLSDAFDLTLTNRGPCDVYDPRVRISWSPDAWAFGAGPATASTGMIQTGGWPTYAVRWTIPRLGAGQSATFHLTFTTRDTMATGGYQVDGSIAAPGVPRDLTTDQHVLTLPFTVQSALPGRVTGAVRFGTTPVSGVFVVLYDVSQGPWIMVGSRMTGVNGAYSFDNLPTHSFKMRVIDPSGTYHSGWLLGGWLVPPGYLHALTQVQATAFTVAGGATMLKDVHLEPAASGGISGLVTDGGGSPLGNVSIEVQLPPFRAPCSCPTDRIRGFVKGAVTAADGTFRIKDLTAGRYWVRAVDPSNTHPARWYPTSATAASAVGIDVSGSDVPITVHLP
jgi:hypothetical protein